MEVKVTQFRFVTYNIRKGKGASGRLHGDVADLSQALLPHRPDLMFCQEVYHGHHKPVAQTSQIAEELGLSHYYEPNRTRKTGHYGNATFTHYPVETMRNHDISTNPIEKRGVLYLRLNLHGRPVHVFNAHLGLNQRQRSVQIRRIAELIRQLAKPEEAVVLAGDFNDWNRRIDRYVTKSMGMTNAFAHLRGKESLTWHARNPVFNLDRVYLQNLRATDTRRLHGAPWDTLSDHFPLWAELEFT